MYRSIIALGMIFTLAFSVSAQNSADSLYKKAKALMDAKSYSGVYEMATTAAQSFLKQKNWNSAEEALILVTNLPYDSSQVNKFKEFITNERSKIESNHPIEAIHLTTHVGAWHEINGQYDKAMIKYETIAKELNVFSGVSYIEAMA